MGEEIFHYADVERLDNPDKNWKFSLNDAKERGFWDDYMDAYEQTIRETATENSPWYVVPADNKWFTRVIVAAGVIDTLASLKCSRKSAPQNVGNSAQPARRCSRRSNDRFEA